MHPYYIMRLSGGTLYFIGALMMTWNVWKTIRGELRNEQPLYAPRYDEVADRPVVQPARA
jgi:cytochrome c oxidase cbb3-type subunit 1